MTVHKDIDIHSNQILLI